MVIHPNPSKARMGVLIVEDQTAIRQMLVTFVGAMPDFVVTGEAGGVDEALRVANATRPSVVILDWMLLGGLGLGFLRAVRIDPPPYVLVFSANTTELAVREALAAGAKGYLEKTASFTAFTEALKAVAMGQTYYGPEITRTIRRLVGNPERVDTKMDLSGRERDVLRGLATGLSSKEIGELLSISVRTVENHRASIMRRTGLRSIAHLTLHAVRLGLIEVPVGEASAEPTA